MLLVFTIHPYPTLDFFSVFVAVFVFTCRFYLFIFLIFRFCFPLIVQCDWCLRDALAELSCQTPLAAIVTVAAISSAYVVTICYTYIVAMSCY